LGGGWGGMLGCMPRPKRICPAGEVFHVLNRAVARLTIFEKREDYEAFLRVLDETWREVPLPVLAMVLMPHHWHFVVRPTADDQVSTFFRRLTVTHTMRWHAHYRTGGTGHLYQGRFKSFPVESDQHLLSVMRYVERNPVRAGLAERAEAWPWGSAAARRSKDSSARPWLASPEDPAIPSPWLSWVNEAQTEAEVKALRHCIRRGCPFGDDAWARSSVVRLGLERTRRPRGRPRKES
jgi:putative transposase